MRNVLLCTDVYKLGHMLQYPPGTTKVYSYLQARSDRELNETVFFGLQYYLDEYLAQTFTKAMADEFYEVYATILGPVPDGVRERIEALVGLGFWPIEIKAVPEGTVMPVRNVLMTITNTLPDFAWCVGFLESLLLKVWNTITVASYSLKLRRLVTAYAETTCDDFSHLPFQVHDFGYRGVSSEETAELSGAAHLLNFFGSDTVPAVKFLRDHYSGHFPIGLSVPATEHSVMCAYGPEHEFEAFEHILDTYPTGIVSIVSDTYNLWRVLTEYGPRLKERILRRDGKVVFRPDSGDPKSIILGDISAPNNSPEFAGALKLLGQTFGTSRNSKGYSVLNPHVGLIYGDGFFFERFEEVLAGMKAYGWASSNLVVGIGGLLLQAHSRDELGFAIKATYAEVNGEQRELFKDPVTDSKKRSHKGLLRLDLLDGQYVTSDQQPAEREGGLLRTVFRDGAVRERYSLMEIRERITRQSRLYHPLRLPEPAAA